MFPAITPHWQARRRFASKGDWAAYLYTRLLRRFPSLPLPKRGSVVPIKLSGHPDPFYIRLGATDLLVLDEMFQTGEYDFVEQCFPKVDSIVDLGANVGFSLRYWHRVFPRAQILAVEPDPDNCRLSVRNVAAARFSHQVKVIQACVGANRRKVRFGGGEEWSYRILDGDSSEGVMTEVLPLAEILETHANGKMIDLLKCDIEGGEQEVFRDCGAWISKIKAIVIELHPPYTTSQFLADLQRSGKRFNMIRQFTGKQYPVLLLQSADVPDGTELIEPHGLGARA